MDQKTRITLHTGHEMPVMGLGTWQLTDDTPEAVASAFALGYRLVDTSGDYGTQPGVGEAFRRSGIERSELYLVTKVEEVGDSYEQTQRNLAELQLEYADLMLIHRPPRTGSGEALWQGLIRARQEGLARDIGVSNYSVEGIDALIDATGEVPAVNQIEWSPFGCSDDMLRHATAKGIIIQAYSPLTRTKRLDDQCLSEIAARNGKSPAQLLIRWNLQRGTVPLPKANQRDHLAENIDVFDFRIDKADMAALNGLNERYSSLGTLPYA
jgi:2,5-diketo-D-gluconate reductase A